MKKLFIAGCLFLLMSWVQGAPCTLESVDIYPFDLGSVVTFTLSDHSTWKKLVLVDNEHYLYDIEKHWRVGEKVVVTEKRHSKFFHLHKLNGQRIVVGMTKETKALLPTIMQINEVTVKQGGWFFGPEYVYHVYLSDDSVWKTSSNMFAKCWKPSDAVLVNIDNQGMGCLINVDAEHHVLLSDGSCVDRRGWEFERVQFTE
ncbi:MAG: hypothetical protein H7A39_02575 [Chlamydiales bacterium]|nr:hypothetical protein [Chlamydiales bacterium]